MKPLKRAVRLLRRALGKRPHKAPADRSLDALQRATGYTFDDLALLRLALTHKSSVSSENRASLLRCNERLEFLGDAILNACVTEHLYEIYPTRTEGQLSKIKSLIVSRKILGEVAETISLGDYLFLGHSETESGGRAKRSIMSNAFEALVGAVYLDGGLKKTQTFLKRFLFPRIEGFLLESSNINYKSKILEMAQRDGFGIPRYEVLNTWGPEHAKMFQVQISVAGVPLGEGSGPNKKIAEQNAAQAATATYDKKNLLDSAKGATKHELVSQ